MNKIAVEILQSAPIGLCHCDLKGHFLSLNEEFARIVGYEKEELIGRNFASITYPDDLEKDLHEMNLLLRHKERQTYTIEKRYFHKSGHTIWIELSVALHRDHNDMPQYFISVIHDITEQRRSQEIMQQLIRLTDLTGHPFFKALVQGLGKSLGAQACYVAIQKEKEPLHFIDVIALWSRSSNLQKLKISRLNEPMNTILQGNSIQIDTDAFLQYPSCQIIQKLKAQSFLSIPLYDSQKKVMGCLCVAYSLTVPGLKHHFEILQIFAHRAAHELQRIKLMGILANRESRFSILSESSFEGIAILKDDIIIDCNQQLGSMYGYAPEELFGHPLSKLLFPEMELASLRQLEQSQPNIPIECKTKHRNGNIIEAEVRIRILMQDDQQYHIAVLRNISDQKKFQKERERFFKTIEDKNKELSQFTYTVSHDLRSPLITIRGILDFLREDAESGNLEAMNESISIVIKAADQMNHLLDSLLHLSRSGATIQDVQPIPAEQIFQEALELLQGPLDDIDVEEIDYQNLKGITLWGDRIRLREVFQNLLENSIKYKHPQRPLLIRAYAQKKPTHIEIRIQDNGLGINASQFNELFLLFRKNSDQGSGFGVGLAIVKKIIDAHQGHIRICEKHTAPDVGCCMIMEFPLRP